MPANFVTTFKKMKKEVSILSAKPPTAIVTTQTDGPSGLPKAQNMYDLLAALGGVEFFLEHFGLELLLKNIASWPAQVQDSPKVQALLSTRGKLVTATDTDTVPSQTATATATAPIARSGVKIQLPPPPKFSRIVDDSDVTEWLGLIEEACLLSRYDKDLWVSFAAILLEKDPLTHWKSHKLMAFKSNTVGELHDWDNFKPWCVKTLNMHDFEEIAFQQLTELKQTRTVIAYKSKFDVLALRAGVTPQQQPKYWCDGLTPDIVRDTRFDPVTRSKYKSIEDAQAVALAADSFTIQTVPHPGSKRKQHNYVADQVDLTDSPSTSRLTDQGRRPLGNHNTGNTTAATGFGFKLFIRGNPQANGSKFFPMLGTNTVKESNWPRQAVAYFQQHSRESPPPPHCG